MNSVSFRVPDFVGDDGVEYTDIVEIEVGDIHDAVRLVKTLERPRSADNE